VEEILTSYRDISTGKPALTLMAALFSDGWTKNYTKKSSFEAFHVGFLNQARYLTSFVVNVVLSLTAFHSFQVCTKPAHEFVQYFEYEHGVLE